MKKKGGGIAEGQHYGLWIALRPVWPHIWAMMLCRELWHQHLRIVWHQLLLHRHGSQGRRKATSHLATAPRNIRCTTWQYHPTYRTLLWVQQGFHRWCTSCWRGGTQRCRAGTISAHHLRRHRRCCCSVCRWQSYPWVFPTAYGRPGPCLTSLKLSTLSRHRGQQICSFRSSLNIWLRIQCIFGAPSGSKSVLGLSCTLKTSDFSRILPFFPHHSTTIITIITSSRLILPVWQSHWPWHTS